LINTPLVQTGGFKNVASTLPVWWRNIGVDPHTYTLGCWWSRQRRSCCAPAIRV